MQLNAQVALKSVTVAMISAVLAACASSPDKIDAAYVSAFKYEPYSCAQISFELEFVAQRTQSLYETLRATRRKDNWQAGVGIILLPTLFALEGGDGVQASEYAFLKGEFEALLYASMHKRCGLEPLSPDTQIEEALTEDTMITLPDNRRVSLSQMLGLLELAYAQNLVTEEALNTARDTAFRLLGSSGDGRNLPEGSLDSLFALINELELAIPTSAIVQLADAPSARMIEPNSPAIGGPVIPASVPSDSPTNPSLESLAQRVEALGQGAGPAATPSIVATDPDALRPTAIMTQGVDSDPKQNQASTSSGGPRSLDSILRSFAHLEDFYVDELPQRKLVQFFNKAGIANTTPVLGYIDTTLWGSGKNGVLFTPTGIYYSNDFVAGVGGTFFLSYDDAVRHAQPSFDKRYFYLGYGALPKRGLIDFVGNDTDLEDFQTLIEEIQSYYSSHQESFPVAARP